MTTQDTRPQRDADAPRRRRIRALFSAAPAVPEQRTELAVREVDGPAAITQSALRAWADKHTARLAVPEPGKIKAGASYWSRKAPQLAVIAIPKITASVLREIIPIARGMGRLTEGFLRWHSAPILTAAVATAESPNKKSDLAAHYHRVRARHTKVVATGAVTLAGGGIYLYEYHAVWLIIVGFIILVLVDLVGRRGQAPVVEHAAIHRQPLQEGMPLQQITASIISVFDEEIGLNADGSSKVLPVGVVQWDMARKQWRQEITTYAKVTLDHARALERGLGVPDDSVRILRAPDTATGKLIVIQYGDPIPVLPCIPDRPMGSLTINDAMVLGESTGDYPFALHFAGSHVIVVGGTGAGKSSVHLNNIIDSLSVCRDVVLWGIDLTRGPLFSMWRGVIQRKAYTPNEANALLDMVLAEIDRRAGILDDIANDDDPTNDTSEWNTSLGPALIVVIDEFPELAKYNGTPKDTLNLLEKVERVYRTGRKHLVSLVIGIQKMGNADTGSSVVSSQSGQIIAGPCTERDTVAVFGTDGRDFGYAPHNLRPGTKTALNDAGKAFVSAPGFGPDVVRGFGAMAPGEIKRRARERELAGLPTLTGAAGADLEAVVVPPVLTILGEALLAHGNPEVIPSRLVLDYANRGGGKWTAWSLPEALRAECATVGVTPPETSDARSDLSGNRTTKHYRRADVLLVLDALSGPQR